MELTLGDTTVRFLLHLLIERRDSLKYVVT
jgi:hypothetical protein